MSALSRQWLLGLTLLSCGLTDRNQRGAAGDGDDPAGGESSRSMTEAGHGSGAEEPGSEAGKAAGGAGGTAIEANGGAANGGGVSQTDPLDPTGPNAEVCAAYLSAWQLRSVEESSGNPGPCYQCLGHQPACFGAREAISEGQQACFVRHCLCDPVAEDCSTFDYPSDPCTCFASCLPEPPHPARQNWMDYVTCELENCVKACQ